MTLWHDVRYAIRTLLKSRGLTIVALLTLALGIGANTAIFSIVSAVLLRPLPFRDPGQLVQIRAEERGSGSQNVGFSPLELDDLRDRAGVFESVSVVWQVPANLTGGERPERIDILAVSPSYFAMLGARPEIGRLFDSRDESEGFAEAAVISDGLWRREFGGDPNVLGRKIRMDNDLYTIVGVLPREFHHPGPATAKPIDMWNTAGYRAAPFPPPKRNIRVLPGLIARVKPALSVAEAQGRLQVFAASLRSQYGSDYQAGSGWSLKVVPLKDVVAGDSQRMLLVLLLAVAVILMIACVNVASLLLASGSARRREVAVRMALGAQRGRIVLQMLTEAAVLGLAAAAVGTVAAFLTENALIALLPSQLPRVNAIGIDGGVLLFTLVVAMATSFLFGLAPALQAARHGTAGLREGDRTGASVGSARTRQLLVGVETALSLMLTVGAGLLVRTFWELLQVNPGFNSQRVMAASIWLPVPNDPTTDVYGTIEQRAAWTREVVRRLHSLPGVQGAALSSALPLRNQLRPLGFILEGQPEQAEPRKSAFILITPEMVQTLGASLVRGRMIEDTDDGHAPPAALVDEAAVRQLWGGQNPIGRRVKRSNPVFINGKLQPAPWMTVVGVVSNIKFNKLDESDSPHIYSSMYQLSGRFFNVVIRATGDAGALAQDIQRQIQSVDANLPVSDVAPMTEVVSASMADRRFAAAVIGAFALVALLLASVGVYGVASYTVVQRSRELGIRAALGATATDLVRLVLRQGMRPVLAGLAAGCVGALLMGRLLSGLLFGVKATDVQVFLAAAALLALFGLTANYLPARRAGKVDPNQALRCE